MLSAETAEVAEELPGGQEARDDDDDDEEEGDDEGDVDDQKSEVEEVGKVLYVPVNVSQLTDASSAVCRQHRL